jgi:hypothetical protein
MNVGRRRISTGKLIVVLALVGAVVFGLYIGYLGYANDSFPTRTEPFADYAQVASSNFNGTEYAFNITWENGSALPLYAQLTSPATDAANTPVCGIGLLSVSKGQNIFMPFAISPASAALSTVELSIAVMSLPSRANFTINYNVALVTATNNAITPSNVSCSEPPGAD